jgi:hypothetical protein
MERPKQGTPVRHADDSVALAKQMESETIEFIESRLEGKFQWEPMLGCALNSNASSAWI